MSDYELFRNPIHLLLTSPVVLSRAVCLAPRLHLTEEQVRALAGFSAGVIKREGAAPGYCEIRKVRSAKTDEEAPSQGNWAFLPGVLYGAEAIKAYGEYYGVDVSSAVIESVDIPADVFRRFHGRMFNDFLYLYRRLESRNARLQRLIELKAPDIIVRCEILSLCDCVESLENAAYGRGIRDGNGFLLRSLVDAGYRLNVGFIEPAGKPVFGRYFEKETRKNV